uniref:Zinc-finger domain-containing protein n=1 Tax=Hanusia phi TaxID=3032 RepID=A0A7S0HT45_9CRYP|mmetsp:Transcript_3590/g.8817  ORF Transcript_3590/g.8817 Transcript_3590/m.8817 type:complete len:308 (+) Transcript_3590:130-1053(+)
MDPFPNPMSLKMLVPEESNQSLAGNRGDTSYPFLDEGARGEERRTEGVRGPGMASMPSDHGDLAGGWKPAGARALVQEVDGSRETWRGEAAQMQEEQQHDEVGRETKSKRDEAAGEELSTCKEHKKNCHFCQHVKVKKGRSMVACETPGCTLRFCVHCLNTQFPQEVDEIWRMSMDGKWNCPLCKQICCCTKIPRMCEEVHRHCKAYRYRDKRAQEQSRRGKDSGSTQQDGQSLSSNAVQGIRTEALISDSILHLCNPQEEEASWEENWYCSSSVPRRSASSLEGLEPLRKKSATEKSVSKFVSQDD